jgi:hypothetical protein
VVLVLTQDRVELTHFKKQFKKISAMLDGIPVITVVNKYDGLLGTKTDVAAAVGVTSRRAVRRWQTLRYNHYIPYCENLGKGAFLSSCLHSRRAEVLDVSTDVSAILRQVTAVRAGIRKIHSHVRVEEGD